jgi:5-methylcytosine-specific restriction protein A
MPWTTDREEKRRSSATYSDPVYKANRPKAMKRDRWRCQIRYPDICRGAATECDHVIPAAKGGTHQLDNLRGACEPCHKRKTAQEGGGWRNRWRRPAPPPDPEPKPATAW